MMPKNFANVLRVAGLLPALLLGVGACAADRAGSSKSSGTGGTLGGASGSIGGSGASAGGADATDAAAGTSFGHASTPDATQVSDGAHVGDSVLVPGATTVSISSYQGGPFGGRPCSPELDWEYVAHLDSQRMSWAWCERQLMPNGTVSMMGERALTDTEVSALRATIGAVTVASEMACTKALVADDGGHALKVVSPQGSLSYSDEPSGCEQRIAVTPAAYGDLLAMLRTLAGSP